MTDSAVLVEIRMPTARCGVVRGRGIETRIGNYGLRATGVTDYLKNGATLEYAYRMINHSLPRTTKLYDRQEDDARPDECEKVGF